MSRAAPVFPAVRAVRIIGIGAGVAYLFDLSRRAGIARGNEDVPGMNVAIGIVALLFLIRSIVTESTQPKASSATKDLLWGVTLGTIATLVLRL